jgi:hypothetical protein
MNNDLNKLLAYKKKKLQSREFYWGSLKTSHPQFRKASKILEFLDKQKQLLEKLIKMGKELHELEKLDEKKKERDINHLKKPVEVLNDDGQVIKLFGSIKEASSYLNINLMTASYALHNRHKRKKYNLRFART